MNNGDWGLGIGDWGLGMGIGAQSPIPNPQSPIPNPQSPFFNFNFINFRIKYFIFLEEKFLKYYIYSNSNNNILNQSYNVRY